MDNLLHDTLTVSDHKWGITITVTQQQVTTHAFIVNDDAELLRFWLNERAAEQSGTPAEQQATPAGVPETQSTVE